MQIPLKVVSLYVPMLELQVWAFSSEQNKDCYLGALSYRSCSSLIDIETNLNMYYKISSSVSMTRYKE